MGHPGLVWMNAESYVTSLAALGLCLARLVDGKADGLGITMTQPEALAWRMDGKPLAIRTGTGLGCETMVAVLDIEPKLVARAKSHGWLVPTWTSGTPGGRMYAYYLVAPDSRVPTRQVAPGCTIRGDGDHVVAPGCDDPGGTGSIAWATGLAPGQIALAGLPAGLVGLKSAG